MGYNTPAGYGITNTGRPISLQRLYSVSEFSESLFRVALKGTEVYTTQGWF